MAIKPPMTADATMCTSRPLEDATEFAASRCSSVVSAGITACAVALKTALPLAIPAATM